MSTLYNKPVKRKELVKRVARMGQVAGVRVAVLQGGAEEGVRIAEVNTGSGFKFTVGISRGLDIFDADFCGRALAWLSPAGFTAPGYFEPEEFGWLRSFGGGLVTTCGLTYCGAPCVDEGKPLGLHGRISNLPASYANVTEAWKGDDYEMCIEGEVVEAEPVKVEHMRLKRKITARLGESRFFINDVVENFGYITVPHMILYHVNLGYPVLDAGGTIAIPSRESRPRDAEAMKEAEKWAEVPAPIEGFLERVYFHTPGSDGQGLTTAAIINPKLDDGLAIYVTFPTKQLPRVTEWKMPAAGNYVVGIEPANCWPDGRAAHRERGDLEYLEAGEKRNYDLEIGVVSGAKDVAELEARIRAMK